MRKIFRFFFSKWQGGQHRLKKCGGLTRGPFSCQTMWKMETKGNWRKGSIGQSKQRIGKRWGVNETNASSVCCTFDPLGAGRCCVEPVGRCEILKIAMGTWKRCAVRNDPTQPPPCFYQILILRCCLLASSLLHRSTPRGSRKDHEKEMKRWAPKTKRKGDQFTPLIYRNGLPYDSVILTIEGGYLSLSRNETVSFYGHGVVIKRDAKVWWHGEEEKFR